MTRYRVFVPSTVTYITEVEADSPDEAIDVVGPGPGLCYYCAKSYYLDLDPDWDNATAEEVP